MILESILSCSCLLLACGSSIHTILKESSKEHNKLLPHLAIACFGFATVGTRSFVALAYKLFLKPYTLDPLLIELEEKRAKQRVNTLDRILGEFSMASIIYSLFCHHDHCIAGFGVAAGMSCLSFYKLRSFLLSQSQENQPENLNDSVHWFLVGGYLSYYVHNNYGLAATYPGLVSSWLLPAEGFYQGWTVKRAISDYMMTAYIILMTQALRPPST